MSAQVYFVPGQIERRSKAFLEWKIIDLSYELSLTCGVNLNYCKSVHHRIIRPIPACENKKQPSNFQNKSLSFVFSWVSRYILFLTKLKGRGRPLLEGPRRGVTLWDYPQEHLVIISDEKFSPFVKFEKNSTSPLFFIDPLTNKHCRTLHSVINLWIDSRPYQK